MRPLAILQNEFPYSVSARSRNKDWYDLHMELVWQITTEQLYFVSHAFNLKIHQYVLMHNHFHLVVTTPECNLSSAMGYFLKETTREIQRYSGRINQIYGGRFHRTVLNKHHYFLNAYKYVYRNPVKARLCANVEVYPYSSLNGLLGTSKLIVPITEDSLLFSQTEQTLTWLNKPTNPEYDLDMSRALRRAYFSLSKKSGKLHRLETELY